MKIIAFSLFCLSVSIHCFSQAKERIVDDFSDEYHAVVYMQKMDEADDYEGWVSVRKNESDDELFRVEVDRFGYGEEDELIQSNIRQLPYGQQSLIMYGDVNFDGKKDLSIRDGFNSCYGGPSYMVYLAAGNGFEYSEEFTDLGQNYCGMFGMDEESKTLSTMTKSGCCWHQYTEYIVKDNKPFPVKIIEEDAFAFPFRRETIQTWNGTGMDVDEKKYLDVDEVVTILSFVIDKNDKIVTVYTMDNSDIGYVLLKDESDEVEFEYPNPHSEELEQKFHYQDNADKSTLSFSNEWATYKIYETDKEVGIDVTVKGKTYNMSGRKQSQTGSLKDITKLDEVKNVISIVDVTN